MEGLEPSTSPLPRECSATELHQPCFVKSPETLSDSRFACPAGPETRKTLTTPTPDSGTCPALSCTKPQRRPIQSPAALQPSAAVIPVHPSRPTLPQNAVPQNEWCTGKDSNL